MSRTKNIAVITIGYNHYAFEDTATALQLMAMMSQAVQVDDSTYSLRDHENDHTHFLMAEPGMPELKFIAAHKFNPEETVAEAKARMDREKADREDVDQKFPEAPAALPAPSADDDGMF